MSTFGLILVAVSLLFLAGALVLVAKTALEGFKLFLDFKTPKDVKLPVEQLSDLTEEVGRIKMALGIRTVKLGGGPIPVKQQF